MPYQTLSAPFMLPRQSALRPSRTRATIGKFSLILSDLLAFLVAAAFANTLHWLYRGVGETPFTALWQGARADTRLEIFALMLAALIAWFFALGHYTRRRPYWDEFAEILRVLCVLAAIDATLLYLTKFQFSRFWFLGLWLGALTIIPILRLVTKNLLLHWNLWHRPAIIIGTGPNALDAAAALESERTMGFRVIAFAGPDVPDPRRGPSLEFRGNPVPIIRFDPDNLLQLRGPDSPTLIVAYEQHDDLTQQAKLISRLHRLCGDVHIVPPLRGVPLIGAQVSHIFRHELFFLSLGNNLARRGPRLLKRSFDLAVSSLLLLMCLPIFIYLAIRIRSDGGPIFFRHRRIGQWGKPFHCLKLRTMVPNAQQVLERVIANDPAVRSEWERDFKLRNDPRVTPLGNTLRRFSIDELAQLWNVLVGEMSLVGPRPIVADELPRYGDDLENYLETKPGMTGLWQISGRNDTAYDERVYLDSWYAKNWSLWMDIVILVKTIPVVLGSNGAY